MKLYFRRQLHNETKGLINRATVTKFLLYARIELAAEEAELVNTYQLSNYFVWERSDSEIRAMAEAGGHPTPETMRIGRLASQGTNVTFDSFVRMLNAEDEIKKSCQGFAGLLHEARAFETEQVVEF